MIQRKELGYMLIDHQHADPLPEAMCRSMGIPIWARNRKFEASTFTCTHCGGVVVMNPERTRERAKCVQCNHLICDKCGTAYAQTLECNSLQKQFDRLSQGRQTGAGPTLILPT